MSGSCIIDVHAHALPSFYLDAMSSCGVHDVDGFPLPEWTLDGAIAAMDENSITAAMLSISSPGTLFTGGAQAEDVARRVNEGFAEVIAARPDRFGAFALLPWDRTTGTLAAVRYALDTLDLDGVGLYTNVHGKYLGDARFEPVLAELNERAATVFVHPVRPPGFEALALGLAAPVIEFPFDTTRAICNLIGSGALRRHPRIRFIFLHGGGVLPFLAQRVSSLLPMFRKLEPELTGEEVLMQVRSLYFDLANASHPFALDAVTRLMPHGHLLYGTDFPFLPANTIAGARQTLEEHGCFPRQAIEGVLADNALGLLPKLSARLKAVG